MSVGTAGSVQTPTSSSWAHIGHVPTSSLSTVQFPDNIPGLLYPPQQYPVPSTMVAVPQNGTSNQPGLSLSPASEPIPINLVQRVRTGQFVEMRDLMSDNIALINQLSSIQGQLPWSLGVNPAPVYVRYRHWLRGCIVSIHTWPYAQPTP